LISIQNGCCCVLYPKRLPRHRCLSHGHRQYHRLRLQSNHRRRRHPLRRDHLLSDLRLLWTAEERNNADTAVQDLSCEPRRAMSYDGYA
ncbi:hypothetical protein ANOM_001400, partial [Aspergillus nomiae NRRL 13137]